MQDYGAGPWGTEMYYSCLCGVEHNVPPCDHTVEYSEPAQPDPEGLSPATRP